MIKRKMKKRLRELANLRLRDMHFLYDVAKDLLKPYAVRYYKEDGTEIIITDTLRLVKE